jgi:hypothetical protein
MGYQYLQPLQIFRRRNPTRRKQSQGSRNTNTPWRKLARRPGKKKFNKQITAMKKHIFHLSHRSSTTILNLIISRNLSNVTYPQVASLGCCFIPALQAAQSSAVWTELVCKKTLTLDFPNLD